MAIVNILRQNWSGADRKSVYGIDQMRKVIRRIRLTRQARIHKTPQQHTTRRHQRYQRHRRDKRLDTDPPNVMKSADIQRKARDQRQQQKHHGRIGQQAGGQYLLRQQVRLQHPQIPPKRHKDDRPDHRNNIPILRSGGTPPNVKRAQDKVAEYRNVLCKGSASQ